MSGHPATPEPKDEAGALASPGATKGSEGSPGTARSRLVAIARRELDDRSITPGEAQAICEALEYVQHFSWRCEYRTRYKECQCGLDALCDTLGLDRVPPTDPEAK